MSVAIEHLLPHRPPMRWLDELVEFTDTTAKATACFGVDHFAVSDGAVIETALVECVAQTVAAALGARAHASGKSSPPAGGMLAAVSGFRVMARPPCGQKLHIEAREVKRFGPMLLVSGTVTCDGQLVASGELTLYA
jgi:predicted hotdog family 3-hydroxylacyl-ACP dehydratase